MTEPEPRAPADRELAAHLDNTPLAVIAWDRDGRVARWSGRAERVFGWTAAEAVGKFAFDIVPPHPDDRDRVDELVREMLAARRPHTVSRNRNLARGGRVVWCEWHNSVLFDAAGAPASSVSLVLDVTEQVTAEVALGREEARLRQFLNSARMLGWEWDTTARTLAATSDFGEFFGLPPGSDANPWSAVHPADRAAVETAVDAARRGGDFRFHFRGTAPGADGRERWFSARGQFVAGPDGRADRMLGVTTDITDRKRAEQEREALDRQLLDAQKWESLGVLAGGVAHDFNNILTIILGSAGLTRRHVAPGSPGAAYLDQIEQAAHRAAGLCREMLAYAGRGLPAGGTADVSRLVAESRGLLDVTARHGRVRFDLVPNLPPVAADEDQVRRVLMNVVMNAGEAVGAGGDVVVRTDLAAVSGTEAADHFRLAPPPGEYVRLVVSDGGPGMSPEVTARLFDPFFTTKFPGRGLGLAAVLGIVKSHRGGIRLETRPGAGTTIETYWPPAAPVVPAPAPAPPVTRAPDRQALIVDDEMFVREVAASTLEDLGYVALLAGDGRSGLDLYRANRATVRVVVLDAVMPGMSGEEVLAAIRAESADVRVVLISGYPDHHPGGRDGRTAFLQKPFRPDDLAAVVERLTAAE